MTPTFEWYQQLIKPSFAPPSNVFGIAWSILYPIILVSFGYVFFQAFKKQIPWLVALPFAINLVANLAFSPIQFGTRNFVLASLDITVVVVTLIWAMVVIWPHSRVVTLAQIPYLLWGLFATVLQYAITWLNR
jgi:tryptophan-rich sensory protein